MPMPKRKRGENNQQSNLLGSTDSKSKATAAASAILVKMKKQEEANLYL